MPQSLEVGSFDSPFLSKETEPERISCWPRIQNLGVEEETDSDFSGSNALILSIQTGLVKLKVFLKCYT